MPVIYRKKVSDFPVGFTRKLDDYITHVMGDLNDSNAFMHLLLVLHFIVAFDVLFKRPF